MSRRMLAIGAGITKGLSEASETVQTIGLAREKMEREKEKDKINQKYKKAQMDKMEFDLGNVQEQAMMRKSFLQSKGIQLDGVRQGMDQANRGLNMPGYMSEPEPRNPWDQFEPSLNLGGGVTAKPKKTGSGSNLGIRKFEGGLRAMMDEGYSREEIDQTIRYSPYANEDFSPIMGQYNAAEAVRNPNFREGRGLAAKFSKNVARVNPATKERIGMIKTQRDLDEFLTDASDSKNQKRAKELGIDIDAIKEYYGV